MSKDALGYIAIQLQEKLSAAEMREMAKRLLKMADETEQLKPYTMEELHERISRAECDFAEGRYMDLEEFINQLEGQLDTEKEAEAADRKLDFVEVV